MRSGNMLQKPCWWFKIQFSILPLGSDQPFSLVVMCLVSSPYYVRPREGGVDVVKRRSQLIHVFPLS